MSRSGTRDGAASPATVRAAAAFERLFGVHEVLVRSPGRVNLIGDHTDYQDGLAMPLAIDREVGLAAARNGRGTIRLWSEIDETLRELPVPHASSSERWPSWTVYVQGVLQLDPSGPPTAGFDLTVASDLPDGAGLSSSAAIELGVALVAAALEGRPWDPAAAADLGRRAENDWVGVATGLMDQLAVAHATDGAALLLDCSDGSWTHVVLPDDLEVLVLDTGARRSLVGSAYDDRRAACEQAAEMLDVPTLRRLGPDWADRPGAASLPDDLAARVRHVVSENGRVRRLAAALRTGDHVTAGSTLRESHASLRDDFEVSGPELDTMSDLANDTEGIIGARMTGGGFAGAVVALAHRGRADLDGLLRRYTAEHDLPGRALVVRPTAGTSLVPPSTT